MYRMFKSFEALWDYMWESAKCTPALENVVERMEYEVSDMDSYDRAYIYAICQAFIMNIDFSDVFRYHNPGTLKHSLMSALLRTWDRIADMEVCNNIMHILHLQDPTMREEGTKALCSNFFDDGQDFVYLGYEGIKLVGGCPVPDQFREQIEEAVKPYGYCDVTVSWHYSHLDMGADYNYSLPENIVVTISCDNVQGLEKAMEAVQALRLVYHK